MNHIFKALDLKWLKTKRQNLKLQRLKAYPSRLNTDSFSAILNLPLLNMQTSLIFLHPGFQGLRWTRDQPMPGPFPAPPTFKGKPWERG